jgi:hypothetical protein
MNDRPPINKEEFDEESTRLTADALVVADRLTARDHSDMKEMNRSAVFMVLVGRVAVKACIFMGRGNKVAALKAADLLHRQTVNIIQKTNFRRKKNANT